MVSELDKRTNKLMDELNREMGTTNEYVEYMRWFDECEKQIDVLIAEIDVAYECFIVMSDYDIFVDDQEKEAYMGMYV